jgi:hypothetical protein
MVQHETMNTQHSSPAAHRTPTPQAQAGAPPFAGGQGRSDSSIGQLGWSLWVLSIGAAIGYGIFRICTWMQ